MVELEASVVVVVKDMKVSMLVEVRSTVLGLTIVLDGVWLKEIRLLVAKLVVGVWLSTLEKEVWLVTAVKISKVLMRVELSGM